jgi:hypothetical protein
VIPTVAYLPPRSPPCCHSRANLSRSRPYVSAISGIGGRKTGCAMAHQDLIGEPPLSDRVDGTKGSRCWPRSAPWRDPYAQIFGRLAWRHDAAKRRLKPVPRTNDRIMRWMCLVRMQEKPEVAFARVKTTLQLGQPILGRSQECWADVIKRLQTPICEGRCPRNAFDRYGKRVSRRSVRA